MRWYGYIGSRRLTKDADDDEIDEPRATRVAASTLAVLCPSREPTPTPRSHAYSAAYRRP